MVEVGRHKCRIEIEFKLKEEPADHHVKAEPGLEPKVEPQPDPLGADIGVEDVGIMRGMLRRVNDRLS